MELRHLRYFIAVGEELHFGRAARRLNVSQPPVSQQIRNLEDEIGVELFKRDRRSVELTVAGKAMLPYARDIVSAASEMADIARAAATGTKGSLIVSFVHSASYSILPFIIKAFRSRYPDVALILREETAAEQVEQLVARRMDVGIARPIQFPAEIRTRTIVDEPFVLALPAHHSAAAVVRPLLKALEGEPFITFPRERAPAFYEAIMRICDEADFHPQEIQKVNTIHTALGLVGAGVGMAIVPASAMRIGSENVVFRLPADVNGRAHLVAAWHGDNEQPVVANFLEVAWSVAHSYSQAAAPEL